MMPNPDFNKIDEYLLGYLKGEELKEFEQEILQDKELSEAVMQRRKMLAVVDAIGDLHMKERVAKIHQAEMKRLATPEKPSKLWRWILAGVILLSIAIALWVALRPATQTPAKLYAAYYEPYPLNFGARSTENEQLLSKAGSFYKNGNFADALPIFKQIAVTDPANSKARLALGICHLELGNYDQAIAEFEILTTSHDPLYTDQAEWYTAMTYLLMDNIPSSKRHLEIIAANPNSHFYQKSRKLLAEF